jgi:phosphopantetheinyl transferase (holo-ACP synthase)
MPRPFPFGLNIGTDICHIPRIWNILFDKGSASSAGHRAERFVTKVLNEHERVPVLRKLKYFQHAEEELSFKDVKLEENRHHHDGMNNGQENISKKMLLAKTVLDKRKMTLATYLAGR